MPFQTSGASSVMLAAAAFDAMGLFGRVAYGAGVTPFSLLAVRFAVAAALLWGCTFASRGRLPRGRHLRRLVLLGGVGFVAQASAYFTALTLIPAGLAAVLLYASPALVVPFGVARGRERLGAWRAAALLLTAVGVALCASASWNGQWLGVLLGVLLGLATAAVYAGYVTLGDASVRTVGELPALTVICSSAALVFALLADVQGWSLPGSASGWGALLGVGAVSTAFASWSHFRGSVRLGAGNAALVSALESVVATLLSAWWLHEPLGPVKALGAALVVAGALIARRGPVAAASPNATGVHALSEKLAP